MEDKSAVLFQVFPESLRAAPGKRHWEKSGAYRNRGGAAAGAKHPGTIGVAKQRRQQRVRSKESMKLKELYESGLLTQQVYSQAEAEAQSCHRHQARQSSLLGSLSSINMEVSGQQQVVAQQQAQQHAQQQTHQQLLLGGSSGLPPLTLSDTVSQLFGSPPPPPGAGETSANAAGHTNTNALTCRHQPTNLDNPAHATMQPSWQTQIAHNIPT